MFGTSLFPKPVLKLPTIVKCSFRRFKIFDRLTQLLQTLLNVYLNNNSPKKHGLHLCLPGKETGGTLTVRHLAEEIEKLTSIEINNQRIAFKGRELKDLNCTLSLLGVRNCSQIHVLKIKYDPDQMKPMYNLNKMEADAKAVDVCTNKLIHTFDTMQRGAIPNQMTLQSIMELKCDMKCCRDAYQQIKFQVLQLHDDEKCFRQKKSQILERIEAHERVQSEKPGSWSEGYLSEAHICLLQIVSMLCDYERT
ncbi:hypothetical protein HELRODRAFT_163782 [Helobdella robusta]|uniref:Ubiquitin-like domain-containing protein n=1 Tax=Helobdella robusta TaxID=6412 RepID=T1EUG9_HELRO|nr:hypothetical protein HELRODRAFT_163782 [Helobdella robusta]ESN96683.1 hypothetical protein HELRODRAFT_163782 [Helobdella robusta]